MIWLVILLVAVAAFAVPAFGKALVKVAVLAALLGVVGMAAWFAHDRWEDGQRAAECEIAKSRIKRAEVELADLELQPSKYLPDSYKLVGRVRNRSARYTLAELRVMVTMKDCTDGGTCEIVGESDEVIYLTVPPGQARGLHHDDVDFKGLGEARGRHQWDYTVQEIIAEQ